MRLYLVITLLFLVTSCTAALTGRYNKDPVNNIETIGAESKVIIDTQKLEGFLFGK